MRYFFGVGVVVVGVMIQGLAGQEKTDRKVTEPRVAVVVPLGMQAGAAGKLTIRGTNLEGATEVRFAEGGANATIVSKGKAEAPDKNTEKYGDTQIVVDVKLDAKIAASVAFTVVTPGGETKPHPLLVDGERILVKEVEPNDGFQKPQVLRQFPVIVDGLIDRPFDVDVYSVQGKKGQTLRVETLAARHGSAFDPHLAIFRSGSVQMDVETKAVAGDKVVEVVLPRDDTYFIALSDAVDGGGPVHAYWLAVELK